MPQNKRTKPCFSLNSRDPSFLRGQPLLQFKPNRHARWSASVAQSALSRKQGVGRGKRVYHRWHTSPPSTVQPTLLCATVAPHPPRTNAVHVIGHSRERERGELVCSTRIHSHKRDEAPSLMGRDQQFRLHIMLFSFLPIFAIFFFF